MKRHIYTFLSRQSIFLKYVDQYKCSHEKKQETDVSCKITLLHAVTKSNSDFAVSFLTFLFFLLNS